MKNIDCPSGNSSADQCIWRKRVGKIRDLPSFGVEECQSCLLVSHEVDLREFVDYESGSMHNWAAGYGGTLVNPKQDIARRVDEISELSKTFNVSSILDFGCGAGEMISALSEKFEVEGLEPEEKARNECKNTGMRTYASINEILESQERFDLVTLFHVVEHFYSPDIELAGIYKLLKPGGLVIIETPNSQDALLTTYKSPEFGNFTYWTHHPMLHSNKSLGIMVQRAQFKLLINSSIQRYGLENHLYWLTNSLPGGHIEWEGMFSEKTNQSYQTDLVSQGTADTIWLVAQKSMMPEQQEK